MKLVVDMNLTPDWVHWFARAGLEAVHWRDVGELDATDREIMDWARRTGSVVFTHDLDFGALLAMTRAQGPSVVQLRSHEVLPTVIGDVVVRVLRKHTRALENGAILSLDRDASRVRVLPLMR